jgi:Trypsin
VRRRFLAVGVAIAALVLAALPAAAITNNYQTDNEHPFVGLVVFYDESGEFLWRCSGSLLEDGTTFLTAGHCTDAPAVSARVWFQQNAGANYDPATEIDPVSGYPEYCAPGTEGKMCVFSPHVYDYGFDNFAGFPNTRDAGVVVLDKPIDLPEYGSLAAVGTLDKLIKARGTQDVTFLASGYGLSYRIPVKTVSFRSRFMGYGGTCSGDSGGPIFYPANTNQIIAVTSFGLNSNCRGVDFSYRVDRQDVQDWISSQGN